MTDWDRIIEEPIVPFGGAKKRIEAIRVTANIAEHLEHKLRKALINTASAKLGISRRKVEEEYIEDLETRGILKFSGDTFIVDPEPEFTSVLPVRENGEKKIQDNPKAKQYLEAKAQLTSRDSKIRDARKILESDGSCGRCGNQSKDALDCFSDGCKGIRVLLGSGFDEGDEHNADKP